jgi:PBSX family phage terminase large subunit
VNGYSLLPAQREFLHVLDPTVTIDLCCYQGGYGSGKSFIGSFLGLELARKYQGSTGLVGALTYPMIRDTTLESYFEHLDLLGMVEGVHYTYLKAEAKLVFQCWGNSKILFKHLDEPRKLKSLNLAWFHLEEGSELEESAFLMALSRLRQSGVKRYRGFITTNPQANKGWIHKAFVENNSGPVVLTDPYTGEETRINYRRVIAPSTENTNLTQAYLESMKHAYDEEYYRINVLGQDGDYTAGLVCYSWSFANIEETLYNEGQRLYLSCDFNVDPMCWVVAHRYNNEYHFIDELCIENSNIIQACEQFAIKYGKHKAGIIITGDASGKNRTDAGQSPQDTRFKILQRELSTLGITNFATDLRTANPNVDSRILSWNSIVCNSQGVRRVKVDPKCKWVIYNMENLKYVNGTSVVQVPTPHQIAKDNSLKFLGHIFDAASYLVERYDPASRIQLVQNRTPKMSVSRSGATSYS